MQHSPYSAWCSDGSGQPPIPQSVRSGRCRLVSRNYNVTDDRALYDYSEHFVRINKLLPVSPGAVRSTS